MSETEAGAPRPRRSLWRIGTPVMVLLSGALFAVSAASSEGTDLRPGRYTDMASLVETEAREHDELTDRLAELKTDVDQLTELVNDEGVNRLRGMIADLKDPAGLEPREGPGVSVTLSDAPEERLEQGNDDGVDPNLFVVHQQDIQAVVNAMWAGGAEAVVIEGQRVISTTGIKCEGNAVQLQGVPYPEPYQIEAVGDPEAIQASLDTDPGVLGFREDAEDPSIGVGWDFDVESHVEAPAYDGLLAVNDAEPIQP